MIKVAVIVRYFGSGGAENMVAHILSHMDLKRFNVHVYCVYGSPQNNNLEREIQSHGVKITWIGKNLGFSLAAVRKLNSELDKFSPNVIHTHLSSIVYAALWVLTHKSGMIHTLHSVPELENRNLVRRLISTQLFRSGKAVPVAVSNSLKIRTAAFYGIPESKVETVYNPVDTSRFYHVNIKEEHEITFIHVGRLTQVKNQTLLLKAFADLYEKGIAAKLVILGSGDMEPILKKQAEELGIIDSVSFEGYKPNVEEYLATADVFVLPSNYEGLPLSVLEAMAAGLPVVATNVGGVADIVTDNGLLVPADDQQALSAAMVRMALDQKFRNVCGQRSLVKSKQYDTQHIAEQYGVLYTKYAK